MYLQAINLTLFEIIILQIGAIILGITIYFFWTSNKALSETLKQSKSKLEIVPKKTFLERVGFSNTTLDDLQQRVAQLKHKVATEVLIKKSIPVQEVPQNTSSGTVSSLKDALIHQQQTLDTLMTKIGSFEENAYNKKELIQQNEELEKKIERLELELETKEGELHRIKQQEALAQQMAARIDEVYKEFDVLQNKIASLEKQAGKANSLTLALEDASQLTQQLQKELARKQEKLEEMLAETQRLHATLSTTEDKLAEANLQRQQLQKKVLFLQDMNNDMQHVSDSNQKLQNELRRIGELESMLSMIAEERDRLLNKGNKE
jgi:chromosome segregation ATPase